MGAFWAVPAHAQDDVHPGVVDDAADEAVDSSGEGDDDPDSVLGGGHYEGEDHPGVVGGSSSGGEEGRKGAPLGDKSGDKYALGFHGGFGLPFYYGHLPATTMWSLGMNFNARLSYGLPNFAYSLSVSPGGGFGLVAEDLGGVWEVPVLLGINVGHKAGPGRSAPVGLGLEAGLNFGAFHLPGETISAFGPSARLSLRFPGLVIFGGYTRITSRPSSGLMAAGLIWAP